MLGNEALEILREHDPRLPFVFFSGTIGEEAAVRALQQGASDYVLKHTPARLPSAVARAIREARTEREREHAEKELMRSQRLDCLAMLAAGFLFTLILLVFSMRNIRIEEIPKVSLITAALFVASLYWLQDLADPAHGRMWRHILATAAGYGVFLAAMLVAFVLRMLLFRRR